MVVGGRGSTITQRPDHESRGGKVVMTTALHSDLNDRLKSLIVVDMAPAIGKISPEYVPSSHPYRLQFFLTFSFGMGSGLRCM